eukprot:TRINITY_DN106191_c0_g1_i1.p1 TRINITY_DN106191_c0_g1~~TRINITY_DN106191_c0_g1_i1.p1  ORF type:complete len:870 (+),score=15.46 TRINITY_DN106191_c0_g1_i1:123-2612(+)
MIAKVLPVITLFWMMLNALCCASGELSRKPFNDFHATSFIKRQLREQRIGWHNLGNNRNGLLCHIHSQVNYNFCYETSVTPIHMAKEPVKTIKNIRSEWNDWWMTLIIGIILLIKGKQRLLILTGLIIFGTEVGATTEIVKTYGGIGEDEGYRIVAIPDGGYYVTGYTASYGRDGGIDTWVLKLDSAGEKLWDTSSWCSGEDGGFGIDVTHDGGCIVAGYAYSNAVRVAYMLKLRADGSIEWDQLMPEIGSNAFGVTTLRSSDYVVVGFKTCPPKKAFVAKVQRVNRAILWQPLFTSATDFRDVVELDNGEIAVIGYYGSGSCTFLRLSSSGSVIAEVGDIKFETNAYNQCWGITKLKDGNLAVAGATRVGTSGPTDTHIIKLSVNGDILWNKCIGTGDHDVARSIKELPNGDIVIAGYTTWATSGSVDMYAFITDKNGNYAGWYRKFGGSSADYACSVTIGSDGAIVVAGYVGDNGEDFCIAIILPYPCDPGTYYRFSTSACLPCNPGTYSSAIGSTFCTPCSPGTYQDGSTPDLCQPCNPGTYQSSSEKTSCDPCLAGTFQDEYGGAHCKSCPTDYYQDQEGRTSCESCPLGKYQPLPGQTDCLSCHPLCRRCYGPNNYECSFCYSEKNAVFSLPSTCECPIHQFYDQEVNRCALCHPFCLNCTGPGSDRCDGCMTYSVEGKPNLCVWECGDGYFRNANICKRIIYSLYKIFILGCNENCKRCTGPAQNECTECSLPGKVMYRGECLDECPGGYFMLNGICYGKANAYDQFWEQNVTDHAQPVGWVGNLDVQVVEMDSYCGKGNASVRVLTGLTWKMINVYNVVRLA